MSEVAELISRIRSKAESVMEDRDRVKAENATLKVNVTELRSKIDQQQQIIEEMNRKMDVLKMAKSLAGEGEENREVKLKINELVREIDKCMALLND